MNKNNHQCGFIALMSSILISFMILAITLSLGLTGFFGRFNLLDAESKARSTNLAEACADTAILETTFGNYPQNKIINVGPGANDDCMIVASQKNQPLQGKTIIKTQSQINKAYTNLLITIDNSYHIIDWQECPNFTASDSSC